MNLAINFQELRKKMLFIATPMYGGQCTLPYTRALCELTSSCTRNKIEHALCFISNESLITRARNNCVDQFLKTKATHLLFIDADIGFDAKDALALMHLQSDKSPYDVIGGTYPRKSINFQKLLKVAKSGVADKNAEVLADYASDSVFNALPEAKSQAGSEPKEVANLGTGFMMIRRETFEKYCAHYPDILYESDQPRSVLTRSQKMAQFFQSEIDRANPAKLYEAALQKLAAGEACDVNAVLEEAKAQVAKSSNQYFSEDYMFCHNVRRAGMKVWLCPWMRLTHSGTYVFTGKVEAGE